MKTLENLISCAMSEMNEACCASVCGMVLLLPPIYVSDLFYNNKYIYVYNILSWCLMKVRRHQYPGVMIEWLMVAIIRSNFVVFICTMQLNGAIVVCTQSLMKYHVLTPKYHVCFRYIFRWRFRRCRGRHCLAIRLQTRRRYRRRLRRAWLDLQSWPWAHGQPIRFVESRRRKDQWIR